MATVTTSVEWARIINTTIRDHMREVEDAIFRRRVWMAKLRKGGRIAYNCSGDGFDWTIRYNRPDMEVNNGTQTVTFTGTNRWKKPFLDYEGYIIPDTMTKRERLKNRNLPAVVKVFENLSSLLMEDMEEQFAEELYVDSSASGNTGRWSGLETFGGVESTNNTITVTSGVSRAENVADPCYSPSDTYAGLSTALGNISGAWTASTSIENTWPFGTGDVDYDYFTPVIVRYVSNPFDGTSTTWSDNAVRATRFAIRALKRNKVKTIPLVLMGDGMFRQYLDNLDSKERIMVEKRGASKGMVDLGFEDSVFQDGAEITSEYGVPSGTAYLLDPDACQIRSMQGTLFAADPVEWNQGARQSQFAVDCLGQFKFKSPRNFAFLKGNL